MFKMNKLVASMSLATATLIAQNVQAAGFALNDHSATASGAALAGAAASDQDISFSFWNPALLTNANADGITLYVSGAAIFANMDVSVNSAADPLGNDMMPTASAPGSVVGTSFVPSIYLAIPVAEKTVLGAALNVPFGLAGDYDDNWAGRYHSAETSIQDISLSFSAAHQIADWVSVGASIQVHSVTVQLDAETTDFAAGGSIDGDGYGNLEADDIAYGYALGAQFTPAEGTRIGIGYRSEIDILAEGEGKYTNVGNTLVNEGVDNAGLKSENTLPSVLTLGLEQEFAGKFTFGATAMLTGWSSMEELRIKFDPGADNNTQPDSLLTFGFEDQWFYSLGLTYEHSDKITLRGGYAYDNSPLTDTYRSARTPDGDRQWFSFGGTYNLSETSSIVAAYTYVLVDDVNLNRDGSLDEDASRGTVNADYETNAHVLSVAFNTRF